MMHNEDYHAPSMSNPNGPSTSDQVLFKLKSGKQVMDKMLMRPPLPPPPPPTAEIPIIDYDYCESIKRKVRVVEFDEINLPLHRWYQNTFYYKEYKNPKEEIFDLRSSDQIKPLDLSFKSAITSTGTAAAASPTDNVLSTLKK